MIARTIEQIRADLTRGNPPCVECLLPTYTKRFVGSSESYYSCSGNQCFCVFDSLGRQLGLGGVPK